MTVGNKMAATKDLLVGHTPQEQAARVQKAKDEARMGKRDGGECDCVPQRLPQSGVLKQAGVVDQAMKSHGRLRTS